MKNVHKRLKYTVFLFLFAAFFSPLSSLAVCSNSITLDNVPLLFFSNPLGSYNIMFSDTLTAISNGTADRNGNSRPYYEKTWVGACPGGLSGSDGSCHEYTVYPDATDFAPGDIMAKIEQYTDGKPNRGEVRIITDNSEQNYVYTTDHETTFCGPYPMPSSSNVSRKVMAHNIG